MSASRVPHHDLSVTIVEDSSGGDDDDVPYLHVEEIDADAVIRLVHTVGGAAYYHLQFTLSETEPSATFKINGREVDLPIF